MVDTPVTPTVVEAASIVPSPVVAPVVAPEPVIAPVPAPVADVAPAPVTAPVVAPVAPAATVLGEALDKPVEPVQAPAPDKPAETVPEVKTQEGQSDEPAPPPKYEPFALPEGTTFEEARMGEFTKLLSGLELDGKASHEAVQKFGQEAVDFHISEVKKVSEAIVKSYETVWEKQKTDWKTAVLNDPEMGGNRIQTTVDSALSFIRTHGGTADQQKEFRDLMETSGLGNNPIMLRMLSNAGRSMSEGKPLAATKPAPTAKSKVATMYGKQ